MTKIKYNLIVAVVTGVETIANGICVYLGASGKIDAKIATEISASVAIVGGAVLGVCQQFVKDQIEQ